MLETWVAITDPEENGEDADAVDSQRPTTSAKAERAGGRRVAEVAGAILRSESEDSGVETENAPSTPGSLSSFSQAHGACDLGAPSQEPDPPTPSQEPDPPALLSSHSAPPQELDPPTPPHEPDASALLSSRSAPPQEPDPPALLSSRSSLDTALSQEPDPPAPPQEPDPPAPPPCVRVEEALRRAAQTGERIPRRAASCQLPAPPPPLRAASCQRPTTPPPLRADPQLHAPARFRCRSLTSPARSGQRSGDLGLRAAVHPPPAPQDTPESSELCDFAEEPQPGPPQPCSSITETDSRSQLEEEAGLRSSLGKDLSPGLGYLEQVCRMLEEIARLQLRNRELQRESQRAQNRQDAHGCQCLSVPPENPVGVRHSPDTEGSEGQSSQPSQAAQRLPPHIRQRSMSDISEFPRSKGEVERQCSWKETVMRDECDGHFPSAQQQQQGRIQLVLKPETDQAAAVQEPLRKSAIPAGKNVPKKIGLIFRKMAKNKSTS
ncbi:WAS/WASL-interacting protein family member 3 [Anguilla anguilla]|uniref:WAS/WASL-interacting protein family member 3 n=1 Tax=Anguilla anguilla TaxID=7936 RepID=UPI0015ACDA5B|nr:WAS/WASL-interacting protein family member 3 [Anguilla anguilla]